MASFLSFDDIASIDDTSANAMPLLEQNWQTTAAVGLTVASGGVAGAIMLAAFPAQTLITGATIGGLAVTGKRRADGKDPLFGLTARFSKKTDEPTESTETVVTPTTTTTSEVVPAVA